MCVEKCVCEKGSCVCAQSVKFSGDEMQSSSCLLTARLARSDPVLAGSRHWAPGLRGARAHARVHVGIAAGVVNREVHSFTPSDSDTDSSAPLVGRISVRNSCGGSKQFSTHSLENDLQELLILFILMREKCFSTDLSAPRVSRLSVSRHNRQGHAGRVRCGCDHTLEHT